MKYIFNQQGKFDKKLVNNKHDGKLKKIQNVKINKKKDLYIQNPKSIPEPQILINEPNLSEIKDENTLIKYSNSNIVQTEIQNLVDNKKIYYGKKVKFRHSLA